MFYYPWPSFLTTILFKYPSKFSLFFLNYGYHPTVDHLIKFSPSDHVPAADDFLHTLKDSLLTAKDNIKEAQLHQAKYADEHRRNETFVEGDEVMQSTKNFGNKKLEHLWYGPYKISKMLSPLVAVLDLPAHMKKYSSFTVLS